jgi:hypothetical protein
VQHRQPVEPVVVAARSHLELRRPGTQERPGQPGREGALDGERDLLQLLIQGLEAESTADGRTSIAVPSNHGVAPSPGVRNRPAVPNPMRAVQGRTERPPI